MGGDKAPGEIVEGARQASEAGFPVVLVGDPTRIGDTRGLPVIEAAEVVEMDEDPARAVRTKKDSSLVRAAEAVRDGQASAMVSAGNTGAAMASALLRMGRIRGVARPAIATIIPVPGSTPTVLLDSGANAECTPAWLVQFAQMGSAFARQRFDIGEPRVGLLSIGEEPGKGSALVKETYALLANVETAGSVSFVGNVEGRDVMSDRVDVVVTDGFTGNVVLKTLEGGVKATFGAVLGALAATEDAKAASPAVLPPLLAIISELDPDTYGGAMLLGVDGVCIISHGSSSARAIFNAVGVAHHAVSEGLLGQLAAVITRPEVWR
jgi:glycerol-3-phosphate acyltransferase PlsX